MIEKMPRKRSAEGSHSFEQDPFAPVRALSEIPVETLRDGIRRERYIPITHVILKCKPPTSLVGIGESHLPLDKRQQEFAGKALQTLVDYYGYNTLFLEIDTKKQNQDLVNSYIKGEVTEEELMRRGDRGIRNFLGILETARHIAEGKEDFVVRCVDGREHAVFRDVKMRGRVLDYLDERPNTKGVFYGGGRHIRHCDPDVSDDYKDLHRRYQRHKYVSYSQEIFRTSPLVRAVKGVSSEPIALITTGDTLRGKVQNKEQAETYDEEFDAVIVHPPTRGSL